MAAPNLKEIEWAIEELKQSESSKANYIFLGALLRCRDELSGNSRRFEPQIAAYSREAGHVSAPEPLDLYGDSEFLSAVAGKDPSAAWSIMDEHMDALRMMNPRVYQGVLRKLRNL